MSAPEEVQQEELGSIFEGLRKPENSRLIQTLKVLLLVILYAFVILVTVTAFFFFDYTRQLPQILDQYKGDMINPVTQPYFVLFVLGLLTLTAGTFFLLRKKWALAVYVLVVGHLICFILSVRIAT